MRQRMSSLVENGEASDSSEMQDEIKALMEEIDAIANSTESNGVFLLDGTMSSPAKTSTSDIMAEPSVQRAVSVLSEGVRNA